MSTRLKPGYKQTEVGVIPEEWALVPFSELLDFRNGVNADKTAYGNGVRFINVLEPINYSHIRASDIPGRVSLSQSAIDSYAIRYGDLVFNRTSETQAEVGLSAVYCDEEPVVFGGFVIRGRPKNGSIDPSYSGYGFRSPTIRSQIVAKGQGAIRANVGQADLRQVLAPLPPLPEQRAIAEALGEVDSLLGALTHLISKKHDLKQAAMQQLLTGFSGEWDESILGDRVVKVGSGITPTGGAAVYVQSGRPFLRSQNVGWGSLLLDDIAFIDDQTHESFASTEIQVGDVFLNITGASIGRSAIADIRVKGGNVNQHVCIIRPKTGELDAGFLNYFLLSTAGQRQIDSFQAGGNRQGLNFGQIRSFRLCSPTVPEQAAIAAELSDMDAELSTLEKRLAKTRDLKEGMMQELLTGRTRLV